MTKPAGRNREPPNVREIRTRIERRRERARRAGVELRLEDLAGRFELNQTEKLLVAALVIRKLARNSIPSPGEQIFRAISGDGIEEFILLTGQGRGTSARSETLTVYSRDGSGFTALTSVPLSDYFGNGARWYYEPRLVRDGDRTVIELSLDWDDYSDGRLAHPELIPEEKLVVIDLY